MFSANGIFYIFGVFFFNYFSVFAAFRNIKIRFLVKIKKKFIIFVELLNESNTMSKVEALDNP